jgi:hypothetical protein
MPASTLQAGVTQDQPEDASRSRIRAAAYFYPCSNSIIIGNNLGELLDGKVAVITSVGSGMSVSPPQTGLR